MQETILQPTKLENYSDIEKIYRELSLAVASQQTLAIDLSKIEAISAYGITAIITLVRSWYALTASRISIWGIGDQIAKPLLTNDFYSQLREYIILSNVAEPSSEKEPLLQVTGIQSHELQNASDVVSVVRKTFETFEAHVTDNRLGTICTVVSEITSNIVHSFDFGFIAIRPDYLKTSKQFNTVTIAITDSGIGIEASLKSKLTGSAFADDSQPTTGTDYLFAALKLGVSSRKTVGGTGLALVRDVVKDGVGSFLIRSSSSLLYFEGNEVYAHNELPFIHGTQVSLTTFI